MTPYRGIIRISCSLKKANCPRKMVENMKPECLSCENALTEVLDLDGNVIYEYRSPEVRTGRRTK